MAGEASIPYEDFGGEGQILHFAHANGYPPGAYLPLFSLLNQHYHILAIRQRPLWPGSDPYAISDWRPLADDLKRFFDEQGLNRIIGSGHSFGATHTLRLAIEEPDRFKALVLIDPVLFPPGHIRLWKMLHIFGLDEHIPPLVKSARRRRDSFESRTTMFDNYRGKQVFQRLTDEALWAYVNALGCEEPDGSITLCYPAEWEAHIYKTIMLADIELWQDLPALKPPTLIIRGEDSDTFWAKTAQRMQRILPNVRIVSIPNTGHLVALEKPDEVFGRMMEYLHSF